MRRCCLIFPLLLSQQCCQKRIVLPESGVGASPDLPTHFDKVVSFIRSGVADEDDGFSSDMGQAAVQQPAPHPFLSRQEVDDSSGEPEIVGEEEKSKFVTDMLRERLSELCAAKLKEERTETFLPRRTQLAHTDDNAVTLLPDKRRSTTAKARGNLTRTVSYVPEAVSNRSSMAAGASADADEMGRNEAILARALQRSGFCSRRQAIEYITGGRIKVDNVVERNSFRRVEASNDIHVEGHKERLRFAAPRLWMFHKPSNTMVGRKDAKGRRLFTRYSSIMGFSHMVPVGSMPYRSHGLLLLTNDGELARFLEHPNSQIQSTYMFRVFPAIDAVLAHKFNMEGINVNGTVHKNAFFTVYGWRRAKYAVKVKVRGKSLPVHQLFQHIGRKILRGGRVSFGPYHLRGLTPGCLKEVPVPPFFMRHLNPMWKPFIERDWPLFRKLRIERLKRLAQFRALLKEEREELDNYSFEELKNALTFDATEISEEADRVAAAVKQRPDIDETPPPLPQHSFVENQVEFF